MRAKALIIGGIVIGGVITAYVAIRKYYLQQIEKLQKEMTYQLVGFQIGKMTLELVEIYLTLRVHSTSTIDAEILDLFSDFLINGVEVAEIKLDKEKLSAGSSGKKNILPAKGYSDIGIKIDLKPNEIKANVLAFLKSYVTTKDLFIGLHNGRVKVKVGPVSKEINFSYDTNLKQMTQ